MGNQTTNQWGIRVTPLAMKSVNKTFQWFHMETHVYKEFGFPICPANSAVGISIVRTTPRLTPDPWPPGIMSTAQRVSLPFLVQAKKEAMGRWEIYPMMGPENEAGAAKFLEHVGESSSWKVVIVRVACLVEMSVWLCLFFFSGNVATIIHP